MDRDRVPAGDAEPLQPACRAFDPVQQLAIRELDGGAFPVLEDEERLVRVPLDHVVEQERQGPVADQVGHRAVRRRIG